MLSKHTIAGGDWEALLALLAKLRTKAAARCSQPLKIVAIHEAGLDGFAVHRKLEVNGVESHIVDPASIAVPSRARRAKTDRIDGETLLRTLTAWASSVFSNSGYMRRRLLNGVVNFVFVPLPFAFSLRGGHSC
jgi:transposase